MKNALISHPTFSEEPIPTQTKQEADTIHWDKEL
jgi:hypothetical protein